MYVELPSNGIRLALCHSIPRDIAQVRKELRRLVAKHVLGSGYEIPKFLVHRTNIFRIIFKMYALCTY